MRFLLDTSTFLWLVSGDARLPAATRALLRSPEHALWLSVVSVWEIAVKQRMGRLTLPAFAWDYAVAQRERHEMDSLALEEAAIAHLTKLPSVHQDPFDRMLICQAIEHELVLVTDDRAICRYPVKTIWNTP